MGIFEKNYTVNLTHLNSSNVISNRGILSILEDVACSHSDIAGFGINDIEKTHLTWVLLSWKVKVFKRVKYGTTVNVHTWAKKAKRFSTTRDFEMLDKDGNVLCIATTKWTLINADTSNLTPITDEIISVYHPDERNVFESPEIEKLTEPQNFSNEFTYKIQRRDIDVNKHVHNLNYLSFAYETLPNNIYEADECNNIEIMYKKATKLGETIKCFYSYSDNANFITIKSEDEKSLHAIVKLY